MATQKPRKGQAWFCTTGLPSDIVIEVDEMSFHLHKFPLMSKSRKLHQLIVEHESNPPRRRGRGSQGEGEGAGEAEGDAETELTEEGGGGDDLVEELENADEESCHIVLPDFPGGAEAFETAAKFCYGDKIDLSASNVAPLRCAGEYLQMTEEFSEDNLISRTERFLGLSVLRVAKDSIRALKSCEGLMSTAESLNLPQRCIDAIATRASAADPSSLFGWPVSSEKASAAGEVPAAANAVLWNGIDTGAGRKHSAGRSSSEPWLEDLTMLSLPVYKRLIAALRARDLSAEIIECSLVSYAKKFIPGLSSRSSRKHSGTSSGSIPTAAEQKELLETVIANLPLRKSSRSPTAGAAGATTTKFLFGLLKTTNILNASEACNAIVERRIAEQLEQAALDDLLLPSYSYLSETLYDVDCVERILRYFLEELQERDRLSTAAAEEESGGGTSPSVNRLMLVGKLIDGYLSEISSDGNLTPERFYNLAVALPEDARLFDDGLYRAVDVYLKAHPWVSDEEREKLCGAMDCQKLTLEACTHAAQNERLPLRAVIQVLFFEQLQLRQAIAGTLLAASDIPGPGAASEDIMPEGRAQQEAASGQETWQATIRENQVLRLDMDSMRSRVCELERECSTMRRDIDKIHKPAAPAGNRKRWSGFGKRFGCKFKAQVCDSHEQTVVEAKKGREQQQRQQGEVGS